MRGEFPGTFKHKNGWCMKVYIAGELHYLGYMKDRQEATNYVQLVESRYSDRLLRPQRGTLYFSTKRQKWIVQSPRPNRKDIGAFYTKWAAQRYMISLGYLPRIRG